MPFFVIKYDINSMAEDTENPGHAVSYMDETVVPPIPMDTQYATADEAIEEANKLNANNGGEEIEITLANGKPYKGPRYVYRVARG